MGSCVSSPMHEKTPDKLNTSSFSSKNHDLIIPPSPIKEKPPSGFPPINDWSAITGTDLGSKEETFFDSRAWLDSDCEDDFYSVNGDFTPSLGNTPVRLAFSTGIPQGNKTPSEDRNRGSISEASPTGKKMKLAELFKQSIREDPEHQPGDEQNTTVRQIMVNGEMEVQPPVITLPSKSTNGAPCLSRANSLCGSQRTASDDPVMEEKPMGSVQCCLSSLISCRNFGERKKKMSPAVAFYG